jgi:hypothetical protein
MLFSNIGNNTNKIKIGNSENRRCRFCGKDETKTTFKNVAHAIPESIGNKRVICLEECDKCNTFFSENIEVHFDKISKIYRIIGQIKGKKKIPSYKTKDKKTRIDIKDKIIIKERIDSTITSFDEENNSLTIEYELEPHIPAAVFKTFVKMAISVMPKEELKYFKDTTKWILHPDHSKTLLNPLTIFQTFIPGPRPNPTPISFLLKKKSSKANYPNYIFLLAYGNIVSQIIVPSTLDTQLGRIVKMEVPIFPTPFEENWKYGNVKVEILDFTNSDVVIGKKFPVQMSYEEKKQIDPQSTEIQKIL